MLAWRVSAPPGGARARSECSASYPMEAMARDRNGDLVELHPPFPIGSPPKSPYHHPRPQPTAPRCGPLSAARPFRQWAGGCWGRRALAVPRRRASEQLVCPGYRRPSVASVQAKPGCKTPCKRVRGNAGGRRILRLLASSKCALWRSIEWQGLGIRVQRSWNRAMSSVRTWSRSARSVVCAKPASCS